MNLKETIDKFTTNDTLLQTTVIDGAANIQGAVAELLNEKGIWCFLHQLALIVKDSIAPHLLIIAEIRSYVKAIRCSTIKRSILRNYLNTLSKESGDGLGRELILDNDTRWNGTVSMLKRFHSLFPHLLFLHGSQTNVFDDLPAPTALANNIAIVLTVALAPFEAITKLAQSSSIPTISCLPEWVRHLDTTLVSLQEIIDSQQYQSIPAIPISCRAALKNIVLNLRSGIANRLHPKIFSDSSIPMKAAALDPRFRVADYLPADALKLLTAHLQDEYMMLKYGDTSDKKDKVLKAYKILFKTELKDFWKFIQNENPRSTDPLFWWQSTGTQFPRVKRLARSFLSIPPSSAMSESDFSVAEFIQAGRANLGAPLLIRSLFIVLNLHLLDSEQLIQQTLDEISSIKAARKRLREASTEDQTERISTSESSSTSGPQAQRETSESSSD